MFNRLSGMKMHKKISVRIIVLMLLALASSWLIGSDYLSYRQQQRDQKLIDAVYHNDHSAVLSLLEKGANPNARLTIPIISGKELL